MLQDDSTLWARKPELERKLLGLANKNKLRAPAGLGGRDLHMAIAEAVDWAIDDFRHKRYRGQEVRGAEPSGANGGSAIDGLAADTAGELKPFPDICIRGTCQKWIETLEPRGEWPRAFLFEEWRMIHSMAIARGAGYGSGRLRYPHCHDLLIGESGITHKNTSINRAVSLIRIMRPDTCILGNVSSIEGVLEELDDKRRPVALIAVGEYSYLVATGQRKGTSNILPVLNDAYDGVDPLTIVRKKAPVIQAPFVNLVAGCTPAWIGE